MHTLKKGYYKGEYTNCRFDICEIEKDGEIYCTVALRDADMLIDTLNDLTERVEYLKKENKRLKEYKVNIEELVDKGELVLVMKGDDVE